jgi:type IV fimbrial biogenesis protein FimT
MQHKGFTLIDLLTSLSVLAILLALGLPSLSSQIQQVRVKTATYSLLDAISLTRTQAVFAKQRATLRKHNEWEGGWEIFIDKNNDGLRDEDEAIVRQHAQLKGIRIAANQPLKNYVSYIASGESRHASGTNGGGFQAGTFTICPAAKGSGFVLVLARGGRVRMAEINEEQCSAAQSNT